MNRNNSDEYIRCIAMAIVNYTNEINRVSVDDRQSNNDKCVDFAETKIKSFLGREHVVGIDLSKGRDMTIYTPPIKNLIF